MIDKLLLQIWLKRNLRILYFFVFEILQHFFKKDCYILTDVIHEDYGECIEAYSLFKYMQKHNIKSKYVLLKSNNSYEKIKNETNLKNVNVITKKCDFFNSNYWDLLHAHTVISSFGIDSIILDKFFRQNKFINNVFLEHGITFLKNVVNEFYTTSEFNYFAVASSYEKKVLTELSDWTENKIIDIGLPRFDFLKSIKSANKSIFIMFSMRKHLKNFKDGDSSIYLSQINTFLSNREFQSLIKEKNITVYFAIHHAIINEKLISNFENICTRNNINLIDATDISKYIMESDLFITDLSSVAFNFMYINKPVIFYKLDYNDTSEKYREIECLEYARSKDKLLYNCYYDENSVINKIKYYLENDFILEDDFKKINDKFFANIDRNNISKNFINKLEEVRKIK